ncbi:Shikimate dehydrogenase [Alkalidesulfovibrio alkalitolerans DSM 16529]|uniref:Shikimate dehydrogenase (NADP(+)) n=1 Tax=Alkalidesulfovibrio alkalitolerans DSM 16529 TaxID=1121439 RepID=S7UKW8_9BACT|nr:shikimate dehydrogenase [Alkalidesulfovibrio alkalitolerans]EPR34499.1 Shikimate dehydrogenase [Alkalidesulfovibrio alkalitolerans DSM 16529]
MLKNFLVFEKICGIIGHPLGHTMSPTLHNAMFQHMGLPFAYVALPTPPDKLIEVVAAVRALPVHGLSVTIPHKEPVISLCDEVSLRAQRIGAVNTLYWRDGGLHGENTDIIGFCAPLGELGRSIRSALVLGAGGVARAAIAGLQDMDVANVAVSNRDVTRAQGLADEFGCTAVMWDVRGEVDADIVINATPLGMKGEFERNSPYDASWFKSGMLAYDLVYNPQQTLFLRQAQAAGCTIVDGLAMFLGQAAEQFRLWTGREMDVEFGRSVCLRALRDF